MPYEYIEDKKMTIGFELTDQYNNHFKAESTIPVYESDATYIQGLIGEQLSAFLSQAGYIRERGYIFMDDVSEDEIVALEDFLMQMRLEKER